jgi:hypothetical protein
MLEHLVHWFEAWNHTTFLAVWGDLANDCLHGQVSNEYVGLCLQMRQPRADTRSPSGAARLLAECLGDLPATGYGDREEALVRATGLSATWQKDESP